jgi:hypothetical protein
MEPLQTNTHKTLLVAMAALFVLMAGVESAFACHQDPCPTYCEGKGCK